MLILSCSSVNCVSSILVSRRSSAFVCSARCVYARTHARARSEILVRFHVATHDITGHCTAPPCDTDGRSPPALPHPTLRLHPRPASRAATNCGGADGHARPGRQWSAAPGAPAASCQASRCAAHRPAPAHGGLTPQEHRHGAGCEHATRGRAAPCTRGLGAAGRRSPAAAPSSSRSVA